MNEINLILNEITYIIKKWELEGEIYCDDKESLRKFAYNLYKKLGGDYE